MLVSEHKIHSSRKYPEILIIFYFRWSPIFSGNDANWRLQIWQDIGRTNMELNYYQDEATYGLVREQGEPRNDMTFLFGLDIEYSAMNHWERQGIRFK